MANRLNGSTSPVTDADLNKASNTARYYNQFKKNIDKIVKPSGATVDAKADLETLLQDAYTRKDTQIKSLVILSKIAIDSDATNVSLYHATNGNFYKLVTNYKAVVVQSTTSTVNNVSTTTYHGPDDALKSLNYYMDQYDGTSAKMQTLLKKTNIFMKYVGQFNYSYALQIWGLVSTNK